MNNRLIWFFMALAPTIVGLIAIRCLNSNKDGEYALNLTVAWLTLNIICSLFVGFRIASRTSESKFASVFLGSVTGIGIAVANVVLTLFAGCALTS